MKTHLLFEGADFDAAGELPPNTDVLIQDLELQTVLQAMAQGNKYLLDVSTRVLLASLDNPESIGYRQRVLADCIANADLVREMYAIAVASFEDRRGLFWGRSSRTPSSILSGSVSELDMYFALLKKLRHLADDHVVRVRSEGMVSLFRSLQSNLDDDFFTTVEGYLKRLRFRDGVLMSAELGKDNSGVNYVLRSPELGQIGWKERVGIGPRTSYSFSIPPRDEAGGNAITDLTSRGINLVANAAAQSSDHIQSYFSMLRFELGFYVGCLNLHEQLVANGRETCFPSAQPWGARDFDVEKLCDVSLTLRTKNEVIGNDLDATGNELVIVTGANSGGKSTFLRSVGQAQLMMQCGMFVTAMAFRASICDQILTHFKREEDSTMESGKFVEEISRMGEIADQITPHSMVLFNESFSGTNEREGSEIARQVVRALLDNDVKVFFVTHQYDFAESFYEQRQNVPASFLRAVRDQNGKRTFKLVVGEPLPTSFGEDVYEKIFLNDTAPQNDEVPSTALDSEKMHHNGAL